MPTVRVMAAAGALTIGSRPLCGPCPLDEQRSANVTGRWGGGVLSRVGRRELPGAEAVSFAEAELRTSCSRRTKPSLDAGSSLPDRRSGLSGGEFRDP